MQLGSRSKGRPVCLPNELIAVLVGYASSAGNYPVCGPCTLAYEMDNPCSHSCRILRASVIISLDCPLPVLPTAPRICCVYDPNLKRSSRCYHQGKGLLKGGSSLPTQSKDLTREKAEVKDRLPIKIPHCIVSSWISLLCSQ